MTDNRKTSKDPRALFEEIDALCAEIDEASLNAAVDNASTIHDVTSAQEARERSKRQHAHAEPVACAVLDIEIQPYESPRDRAFLLVRSSAGVLSASVEVAECYGLLEFLLARGFAIRFVEEAEAEFLHEVEHYAEVQLNGAVLSGVAKLGAGLGAGLACCLSVRSFAFRLAAMASCRF